MRICNARRWLSDLSRQYSNILPFFKIGTTVDFNTLTTEGIYTITSTDSINCPESNNCLLMVIESVGTPFQLWMGDNLYTMYKRCSLSNGQFSGAWTRLF